MKAIALLALAIALEAGFLLTAAIPAHRPGQLAAVVGIAQTAGQLLLVVHRPGPGGGSSGCVPAIGRGAELGLRLTLLRQEPTCPNGTLAVSTTGTAATAVILTALAILLGHTLVALLAAAVPLAAEATVATVRALRALVTPATPSPLAPCAAPRALRATPLATRPVHSPWTPRPAPTRGPPPPAGAPA